MLKLCHGDQLVMDSNPGKPLGISKGNVTYHVPLPYLHVTRRLLGLRYPNIHQSMSGYFFPKYYLEQCE